MTTDDNAAPKPKPERSNLLVRTVTALVGAPLILVLVALGGWPFLLMAFLWAAFSMIEFYALGHDREIPGNIFIGIPALVTLFALLIALTDYTVLIIPLFLAVGVIVFVVESLRGIPMPKRWGRAAVTLAGLAYAGFPAAFLVLVRNRPDGLTWLLFIVFATWGTDTFAYFGGRWWGKNPLAPRISPKKTVEGALVGMASGFALSALVLLAAEKLTPATLGLALLTPPIAVMGDLFESAFKRFFHVKDSHLARLNLIPGHGGVLDRTDSLVWVTSLCYIYLLLIGA